MRKALIKEKQQIRAAKVLTFGNIFKMLHPLWQSDWSVEVDRWEEEAEVRAEPKQYRKRA